MKKILYIILFIGIFAGVTSCADHRRDGLMPSKVYMVKYGVEEYASTSDKTSERASAWATKSGLLASECTVVYIIDPEDLEQYNNEHGSNYEMLPENCYTQPEQMSFSLKADDLNAEFAVIYNPSEIFRLQGSSSGRYALPVRIEVNGLELVEEKSSVIMTFKITEPGN